MNFTLVAPLSGQIPACLPAIKFSEEEYVDLINEIQCFRGRIYVEDQAIPQFALDSAGRHYTEIDYHSWHVVARTADEKICGVMRIPIYNIEVAIERLQLFHVLERMEISKQILFKNVITNFIKESSLRYPLICEPGGWAVDDQLICRLTGMKLAASVWSVLQLMDDAIAITTATVKHKAADLLKCMGGHNPMYQAPYSHFYDVYHRCDLEILFFNSDKISPRFVPMIAQIKSQLINTGVVAAKRHVLHESVRVG